MLCQISLQHFVNEKLVLKPMIFNKDVLKERLKNFARRQKTIKYKRFDMDRDPSPPKPRSFGKIVANLFQRFLVLVVRFFFKNVIYGAKGQSMPPIKNLLLLEPASVLAMKIRTKKVCSSPYELLKTFTDLRLYSRSHQWKF